MCPKPNWQKPVWLSKQQGNRFSQAASELVFDGIVPLDHDTLSTSQCA